MLNSPIPIKDIQNKFATSGVYAIYCKPSDTYYIGQSTVVLRRLIDHFSLLSQNQHQNGALQREYNEFGESSFVIDLLSDLPDAAPAILFREERKEIQRFKLHHKRLYNKTSLLISGYKSTRKYNKKDGTRETGSRKVILSHSEKEQPEEQEMVCYECGQYGILSKNIFACDDSRNRCEKCIEIHLSNWAIFDGKNVTKKRKTNKYIRYQYFKGEHIQERLLIFVGIYFEKYHCIPHIIYIGEDANFNSIQGIKVEKRDITPTGYLDFPLGGSNDNM